MACPVHMRPHQGPIGVLEHTLPDDGQLCCEPRRDRPPLVDLGGLGVIMHTVTQFAEQQVLDPASTYEIGVEYRRLDPVVDQPLPTLARVAAMDNSDRWTGRQPEARTTRGLGLDQDDSAPIMTLRRHPTRTAGAMPASHRCASRATGLVSAFVARHCVPPGAGRRVRCILNTGDAAA